MPDRLILLTGEFDAGVIVERFSRCNPNCPVEWVTTLGGLLEAVARGPAARLVSFCSGVIVPGEILERMAGPSYNFHPGPPTFPGRHPECWGAYLGAERFGATLHVMTPRVDEGPIIATKWFDVPPGAGQSVIAKGGFAASVDLLVGWRQALMTSDEALVPNGERWEGRKWRRADLDALSRVTADIDEAEFERRRRAFAELPGCSLTMELHGRVFTYTVPNDPAA
jgi:methionyl-tRNA formyltransferase